MFPTLQYISVIRKSLTAEKVLFAALLIAYVALLWTFHYIPTEDGPAHLGNAYIIKEYHNAAAGRLRDFYVLNWRLPTNVVYHYALAALLFAVPPLVAEKLLLSLYLIIFATGVRYLIIAIHGRPHPAAFLAFPLFISYPFQMGFFGSMLSLACAVWGLAYFWRRRAALTLGTIVMLNAIGLAIFAIHLFGWGVFVAGVIYLSLARGVGAAKTAGRRPVKTGVRRRWLSLPAPVYLSPAVAIPLLYFFSQPKLSAVTHVRWSLLLKNFLTFEVFNSFFRSYNWATVGTAVVFAALAVAVLAEKTFGRREFKWHRGDVAAALAVPAATAAYLLCSDSTPFRGSWIGIRLALLPILAAVVWLAGARSRPLRLSLFIIGPVVALLHLGAAALGYAEANIILSRYTSAYDLIAADATILPITKRAPYRNNLKVSYVKHAGGYYTLGKRVVDLANYEPNYRYFPVQWRNRKKPVPIVRARRGVPYYNLRKKYEMIDYLLYWQAPRRKENEPPDAEYELIYENKPLFVFKRTPAP